MPLSLSELNTKAYEELDKTFKTLLKNNQPKGIETIKENTLKIIRSYNQYLLDLEKINNSVSDSIFSTILNTRFLQIQKKLKRVFTLINCQLEVKNSFLPLNSLKSK